MGPAGVDTKLGDAELEGATDEEDGTAAELDDNTELDDTLSEALPSDEEDCVDVEPDEATEDPPPHPPKHRAQQRAARTSATYFLFKANAPLLERFTKSIT